MATATVAGPRKTILSNENQDKLMAKESDECRGKVKVEDILSKCHETSRDRVFEIDLHACKITRIENCHTFAKLRILDLSCNQIKAIQGLDKNLELKELKLYSNRIARIEGLDKLMELCSLQLQDNKISKLNNGLKNLKKLKSLRLDSNEISSISLSELASCSKLTYLNVSQNTIEDISFVNCLPQLEEFYASHNKVIKVPNLGRCKKLKEFDLSYNRISCISSITSLPALLVLRLEHNVIKDFDSGVMSKTLEELYLGDNRLRSVKNLPTLFPFLEVLDVSCNALNDLDKVCCFLQGCTLVRELNIGGNPCTSDLGFVYHQKCLRSLPGLEVLDGNLVKRPQSSQGRSRPPMRPVSASKLLSTRQLEEQVSAAKQEQDSFESLISSKFSIVFDLLNKLPEKGKDEAGSFLQDSCCSSWPGTSELKNSQESSRPASRCGSRARIEEAIAFAEQHFNATIEG